VDPFPQNVRLTLGKYERNPPENVWLTLGKYRVWGPRERPANAGQVPGGGYDLGLVFPSTRGPFRGFKKCLRFGGGGRGGAPQDCCAGTWGIVVATYPLLPGVTGIYLLG
jgi:hypothetical protein